MSLLLGERGRPNNYFFQLKRRNQLAISLNSGESRQTFEILMLNLLTRNYFKFINRVTNILVGPDEIPPYCSLQTLFTTKIFSCIYVITFFKLLWYTRARYIICIIYCRSCNMTYICLHYHNIE